MKDIGLGLPLGRENVLAALSSAEQMALAFTLLTVAVAFLGMRLMYASASTAASYF